MNKLESYQTFISLKLHFSKDNFDFFQYKGKTKRTKCITENVYNLFDRLLLMYGDELFEFLLSNIVEDIKVMPHQLFSEECVHIFKNWKLRNQSLTFIFKSDIINLLEHNSLKEIFGGSEPILLRKATRNEVSLETMCILHRIFDLENRWINLSDSSILWKYLNFRCKKYHPFLKYDRKKIITSLKEVV